MFIILACVLMFLVAPALFIIFAIIMIGKANNMNAKHIKPSIGGQWTKVPFLPEDKPEIPVQRVRKSKETSLSMVQNSVKVEDAE